MTAFRNVSREQRLSALARANEIRLRRAALKRWIAEAGISEDESRVRATEVLLGREEAAVGFAVGDLLRAIRGWGVERTRKALFRLRISETKPLGALTDRQARLVAAVLVPPADGPRRRRQGISDALRERIRELGAEGLSVSAISRETGVARQTVAYWVDPAARERAKASARRRKASLASPPASSGPRSVVDEG